MQIKLYPIILILFILSGNTFAQATQPNILLIIADDLGNDAIEGFGVNVNNFPETPNLKSLQDNGVTYRNNWSQPICSPTRAAIMSGKYGIKNGVMEVGLNLGLEHESIFSYLDRNTDDQYATAVIGKWHLSNPINFDHPAEHGVDHFEGLIGGGLMDYYSWNKVENGEQSQVNEYITTHLTDAAIDWVDDQDKPWFLWLSHIAPHSPFQLPPDGLYTANNPTSNRQLYNASIEALDHEIGRLLDSFDAETRENTLIIFIGDNGTPNSVLRGYPDNHGKGSLYEGGLRVPMIMSGNGVTRMGDQEFGLTQVSDLHATLIELCSNELEGGINNSYSIKSSLTEENSIERNYIYADVIRMDEPEWAIRNQEYKLITNESGPQEFYKVDDNTDEDENLLLNLSVAEAAVLETLETEANIIRTAWSSQDFILNGNEQTIDDCTAMTDCPEVDVLSTENIGCCDTPEEPSVYHEFLENGLRNIYSNGFPNHDYCYNPNNIPGQSYHYFRVPTDPLVSDEITSIVRDNGRPARHFGVALNGVFMSPAPGTPFIYTNKITGEFNWDWVFEPTNNQGDQMGQVRLDCATAHTNGSGYHYHGEMFEHLETMQPGITTATSLPELFQVGWASDGHPIIYKFGPDANGEIKELQPSFQLLSGERPGDGIVAPCGPYTGKYTRDYEYIPGLGDLDECNGIAANITLETALGTETFAYYYVVTSSFPQISRCLVGTPSQDFENGEEPIVGVDADGDGYLSQFECNDNDVNINPSQEEIPYNGIDDDCNSLTLDDDLDQDGFASANDCDDSDPSINPDAEDIPNNGIDEDCNGEALTSVHELANTTIKIYPNPATTNINIEAESSLAYSATMYDLNGKQIVELVNPSSIDLERYKAGTYLLEIKDLTSGETIVERIVVEK